MGGSLIGEVGMGGSMIGEGGDGREYDRRGRGWEGV